LWSIINEAGGATDVADLTRVTIVRGGDDAGKVEVVNVRDAIANGTLNKLPKIRRKDTIELPRTLLGLRPSDLGRPSVERKNVIYVVGAVEQPGPITFEENIDVLEAISLAGGPAANADLEKAKVVGKDGYYAQTMQINLDKYAESGKPSRYILQKEDIVVLPDKGGNVFGSTVTLTVAVLGAVTSAILVYNNLTDEN
jgi:hypothetical protein